MSRHDGVTFIDSVVKTMKKGAFVNKHMPVYWQHLSEEDRRKKLSLVYDNIKKGKSVESEVQQ